MTLALFVSFAAGALPYGRGAWAGLRGLLPVALALLLGFGPWGAVAAAGAAAAGAWLSPFRTGGRGAAAGHGRLARAVQVAFGAMAGLSPLAVFWALAAAGLLVAWTGRRAWAARVAAALSPTLAWSFHAPTAYTLFGLALLAAVAWPRRAGSAGFRGLAAEQR